MFKGLTNTPSDIFNTTIPILRNPPDKRINLEEPHRPFDGIERVNNILASSLSASYAEYIKQITLNNISLSVFPQAINLLPALIYITDATSKGVVLNIDVCSARLDMTKNKIIVQNYNNFASSILYGLTKLILYDTDNETVLNSLYFAACAFCYSLLMRCYIRDFDILKASDQELGTIFYLIARLICSHYFDFQGNDKAIAFGALRRFFSKEKKSKIKFNIKTEKLPSDNVSSWSDIFRILTEYNIMPNITVDDFRNRITRMFGATCTICVSSGFELVAMMNTINIASDIFYTRIGSINPSAIRVAKNAIQTQLKSLLQQSDNKGIEMI